MKILWCTLLLAMVAGATMGQVADNAASTGKKALPAGPGPVLYFSTSTGINNNTGILGFNFELTVSGHACIDAGLGTGTWNDKVYLGGKYYLKAAQRGWAFGGGITYATGTYHHQYEVTTIYGDREDLTFNKNPQTNLFFAAYKYWTLGRRFNRIYAEFGWSTPLTYGEKLTQLSGPPITDRSRNQISDWAPGGPIIGFGFSFGMHY